jgi:hypothetical protein
MGYIHLAWWIGAEISLTKPVTVELGLQVVQQILSSDGPLVANDTINGKVYMKHRLPASRQESV